MSLNLRNLDPAQMQAALTPLGVRVDVGRRLFSVIHRDGGARISCETVRGLTRVAAEEINRQAIWP
jgi:hypothetical protein